MAGAVIEASGLGKVYRHYRRPADRLLEALGGGQRHRALPALEDVTFTLPAGEGLGVIGENGAGKSTLLKLLCGVAQPTSGSFRMRGRVAAILELGAGFHPEFSGRQNAILNAALLGLSEPEVQAALPRILDFSELGDFFDRPVKTYSTGMAMRLAFSIATQVQPEILIVDEALSVGDGYFQKKCLDRLLDFIRSGGTVLFCSHAMYYVTALCRHALWLRQGRVERFGPALEVVQAYEEHLAMRDAGRREPERPRALLDETPSVAATAERFAPARILGLRWADDGSPIVAASRVLRHGQPFAIELEWESDSRDRHFHLGVGVDRADGVQVLSIATHHDGRVAFTGTSHHTVRLELPALPIVKGEFALFIFLLDEEGLHIYDQLVVYHAFRVEAEAYRIGLLDLPHAWSVRTSEREPSLAGAELVGGTERNY